jgi:chemotaxis protein CheC
MLTPLQKDVLAEILNVQLGKSASLLSEMVNQKIILSVPEVDLKKGAEFNLTALRKNSIFETSDFVVTSVAFGKEFTGNALVIFPDDNANVLVKACLGDEMNHPGEGLSSLDADVIKEICNIILNSIVGEFGNLLDRKLEYTSFELGYSIESLDDQRFIPADSHVLLLYTSFLLTKSQIRGVILIALSSSSFDMLLEKINHMLGSLDD